MLGLKFPVVPRALSERVADARAKMDAAGPNEFVEIDTDLFPFLGREPSASLTSPAAVPRETWRSKALGARPVRRYD